MNVKPVLSRPHAVTSIAAALAVMIALGLLAAVTGLFKRDGTPFEQVIAAEHACAHHKFVSAREDCERAYLATRREHSVASR